MAGQAAEIIALLRWQRHDILNHLQVISGYLQLQKSERALDYLKEVVAWMEQVGRIMRLHHPDLALAALYKIEQAAARGITLHLDIHTGMEHLSLEPEAALEIWRAAWDLALAMAEEGGTLQVKLAGTGAGYQLCLRTPAPAALPAAAVTILAGLTRRHKVPFIWEPDKGVTKLVFPGRPLQPGPGSQG